MLKVHGDRLPPQDDPRSGLNDDAFLPLAKSSDGNRPSRAAVGLLQDLALRPLADDRSVFLAVLVLDHCVRYFV